jgi:hypothetical protein
MPPIDPEHYCIQTTRIEKMDQKLDDIHDEFQVNGTVGVMSGQLKRLTTLAENGHKENTVPTKILYWIIAGLVAILAVFLGVDLPGIVG